MPKEKTADQSKAYKLYNPNTRKIIISRAVVFYEDKLGQWSYNAVRKQIPASLDEENDEEAKQLQQQHVPAVD